MPFLIVGLGNPGPEYDKTRHNAGFWAVDRLAKKLGVSVGRKAFSGLVGEAFRSGEKVYLLKPQTYMNRSGESVAALARFHKLEPGHVLVLCDDLDLPPGKLRLRIKGGTGGHRGLESITSHLGSNEFPRLRIGIGRPEDKDEVVEFVLGAASREDAEALSAAVDRAVEAVEVWLEEGIEAAMNRFNVQ